MVAPAVAHLILQRVSIFALQTAIRIGHSRGRSGSRVDSLLAVACRAYGVSVIIVTNGFGLILNI